MTVPITTFDGVLAFSQQQPLWVQDTLRRIVAAGSVTAADLDHAVEMCKTAHGLTTTGSAATPIPLARTHLPASAGASADVTLQSLGGFSDVNALLPGQVLNFGADGLTVIYGGNGTGKSGYARVLKKLCRARGTAPSILGNVFDSTAGVPSATIAYAEGGVSDAWTGHLDGTARAPDSLTHVMVYDRASGSATIAHDQAVTLLPPGLDVLPRLADVLNHVASVLREQASVDTRQAGFPAVESETSSAAFLASLGAGTTPAELDAACAWAAADAEELDATITNIKELQTKDSAKFAEVKLQRAKRLQDITEAVAQTTRLLGENAEARVRGLAKGLATANAAVTLHGTEQLPPNVLPGTGQDAWKLMWEAARAYSMQLAYPDHPYPNTGGTDARCVLCQQPLDDEARARVVHFEAYVQGTLAKAVDTAKERIAKARQALGAAVLSGMENGELFAEAALVDGFDTQVLHEFVALAIARRDSLLSLLDGSDTKAELPTPPVVDLSLLKAATESGEAAAAQLGGTGIAAALTAARQTRRDLEQRKKLHDGRLSLDAEVERLKRGKSRKAALADCRTHGLSHTMSALTKEHVTDAMTEAFNAELSTLVGTRLRVELVKVKTRKGETFTGLALKEAASPRPLVEAVFSEGEQRAVALAQFFAELSLSASRSAIVFDDPVTSLDHVWRKQVATRLASEASNRQVIVFTHDATFLTMLLSASSALGQTPHAAHIQRQGQRPGYCSDDLPWSVKTVKKRVKALTNEHVTLTKTFQSGTDEEYAKAATAYLNRLRKTWERAVEECLFNKAIQRFGFGISTKRLAEVDVQATDYAAIEAGMSACSKRLHDAAQPLTEPAPDPTTIAEMFNSLADWVDVLKARRPKNDLPNIGRIG